MGDIAADAKDAFARAPSALPARQPRDRVAFALVAGAAFSLYCFSSLTLEARNATQHFGADTIGYTEFALGNVFERMASTYALDRIARFHLTTVVMSLAWMELLSPFTVWISP